MTAARQLHATDSLRTCDGRSEISPYAFSKAFTSIGAVPTLNIIRKQLQERRYLHYRRACCVVAWIASSISAQGQGEHLLSLQQAIQEGLRSPAAQVYKGQADQAAAAIRQAGLRPNPRLYLQSEDLRPWDSSFSMANDSESTGYLGQTIEIAGKRGKRISVARANAERAEADAESQRRLLAGRIAQAYWNYAATLAALDLQKQNLQSANDVVRYHDERVKAGAMRGVDLLRMQLERDRAMIDLQTAETNADVARLKLLREMGHSSLSDTPHLSDPLTSADLVEEVSVETAILHRADVSAANSVLRAAEADASLQRANGVPDPDFIGGYKRNLDSNSLYAGLQFTLPLFNRNQGEVGRADAATRTARAQLLQTQLSARSEIESARAVYARSKEIATKIMPDMQTRAKRHLAILDDAYRSGGIDLLRYIDARRLAAEVELSAYQRLVEYHDSAIQLQLAYGEQP